MATKFSNNSFISRMSYKKLNSIGRYVATIAAILFLAIPQSMLAETKTVQYYPTSSVGWDGWQSCNSNNTYVTLTSDNTPTVTSEGRLRITELQEKAKQVTFTSKANTYIASYSYTAYQPNTGGTYAKCYAYFKENGVASSNDNTFTITDAKTVNRPENGFVDYTSSKTNALSISLYNSPGMVLDWGLKTVNTYGAINNVVLNLLIPEVKTALNGQTAPTDKTWVDKTWDKNTEKSIEIVYDVKDALAPGDFAVSYSKTAGNGTFSATITSFDPLTQKLTVTVKYKTADRDDYAENFSGTVTVSSVNTVNTATYTTTINGTAGAVLSDNNLRFDIDATQFVNTHYTTAVHTYTNSDATVTYSSSEESVAYFADEDQTLHIVGVGSAKLTATQSATTEIKSGSAELTITVTKRTANFVYTPSGNLYTSHKYPGFVTVDNDPNNSLPQLTYESDMKDKFMVDADGTARTYAVTATPTLTITADNAIEKSTNGIRWQDEWNAINVSHPVTIVKDPTTVEFCMSEAYVELGNTEFCNVTGTGDAFWANNNLKIGSDESSSQVPTTVVLAFKGIPNQLTFEFNRPNDGIKDNLLSQGDFGYTLNIYESADGISWSAAKYTKTKSNNNNTTDISGSGTVKLASTTRYLKIEYTGCVYVYFSSFCVTAATDMTVDPTSLALETTASGTTGEFTISHSNMDSITITSSNTAFTVNQSTFSFENGLGIGAFGEIDVTVSYDGSKPVAASDSLTITGKKVGGGEITQKVALSVIHPTHYVRAVATVQAGQGKVFVNTDGSTPASGDYVTPSKSVDTNCEAAGSDSIDFYYYAQPDAGWNFAGWRETPAAMSYIDQPNDAYLKQTFAALSKNSGSPTTYNRYAIFFKGYPAAPEFGVSDFDMGYTFSGGQIVNNLTFANPRYIERDKVTVEFVDIAGHVGEASVFSQYGTYNMGAQGVAIRFLPVGAHMTAKTYQAKAIVTAKNTEYDLETGEPLSTLRETVHECIVTATCYPAELAAFIVPTEIDFGAPITIEEQSQTQELNLTDIINVYGTPTISFDNSYFVADAYNTTTHSFTIHYNTSNQEEGLLTTTATITGLNADGVATVHTTTIKIFIGKPDFALSNLNLGSTTSGGDNLYGYLELESANGIDANRVSITITDAAGHAGESQYFSYLTENPEWEGEEDTEHDQYISTWNPSDYSFFISFVPSAATPIAKTYQATVTITAINAKGTTTQTATISATVNPAGAASFTIPASHTFNSVQRNVTDSWEVVPTSMQNIVGAPDITISGTNAAYFSYGGYDAETYTITLNFTPLIVGGPYSATATVTFYNRDGVGTSQNVNLTGSCIAAPAADFDVQNADAQSVVTSAGVYYGDFYVGEAASIQTFYLANISNMKVGSTPVVNISPAGIFTATAYNASTKSFGISFEATAGMTSVQNAVASFTMLNNDDQPTTKVVPLSAFVVVEPDYDVEVLASDGMTVLKQGTWAECLDVANTPANANCTMRLVKSVNLNTDGLTAAQEIKNTFTLDLNGKRLTFSRSGSVIYVNKAGVTLTVKDSKSGGTIENIGSFNTAAICVFNVTAGNLIIKNGNYTVENTYAGKGAYAILQKAGTDITINGGTIKAIGKAGVEAVNQTSNKNDNTILTINNGELSAEGDNTIYGIDAYGKVNINGGTITAKLNGTDNNSNVRGLFLRAYANATPSECYHATLTMTGGTVNAINNYDHDNTHYAYGIYFECANAAMGTSTATDGSHANKAAAVGTISNATINASTLGRYAYGVIAYGSYNSQTETYDVIRINNSTINATAKYYYAYGVYANAGVNGDNGACYAARIDLNENKINAVSETYHTACAVYGHAAQNTLRIKDDYNGEYAVASTLNIYSGEYTATAATANAYAVLTAPRVKTVRSTTVASNRDASTDALGALGGNKEAYPVLNIYGGTYKAKTLAGATAHTIRSGGNTQILSGEFESNAATNSAVTIYVMSGKTTVTGATLKASAKTDANAAYCHATVDAYTLYAYAGEVELNNCTATVNTTETTNARGIYVHSTTRTHLLSEFNTAKTANNSTYTNYGDYWQIGCRSISGKATINGGSYIVKAYTSNAYGALLTTNSLSTDGTCKADGELVIKNATFTVEALGTNGTGGSVAYGVQAGGKATIDGCTINAATKTSDARGVYSLDEKTVVSNSTINATTTTSSAYGIIGTGVVANNGVERVADFELNEGNKITVKANTEGAYAIYMTGTTGGAYATDYFTGSMAVAASAVVNGGSYTANATTKTAYALHVSGVQVKNEASATPSIIVNDGKFKGTSDATFADVSAAGIVGHVVLNGGYYVNTTNLNKYVADGLVVTALANTRTEYTEGYRYEIAPPGGNYVCQIGSTKYKTLEEALSVVTSGQTIYMIADYTLPAGDYILPSGATLLIPYTTTSGKGGTTAIGAAAVATTSATTPTLFRKLTFASGANLTSFGTIETSAQQKANGQYGANVGMASGPYGQLDLKEGSHIEMESGANLYCWGFVTGKGTINVKKGANTLEGFQLGDWCGGTNASNLIGNKQKVFPITHYFFQSIECPITYRPGSTAKGSTHVSVSILGVVGQDDISLVGTSGAMFLMTNEDASADTWVMRDYDETTDQCVWTLNSGASIGNLTIIISSYKMESKNYDLPIASNMSIVMNYGTMSIGQNVVFLPGSKLIVNKEGTLDINGVSVVAYDTEDWTGTTRYYATYSPSWGTTNPRKNIALQDAEFFVHGKINIRGNGGVYTSAGGANIHSTNADAGEVKYTTAATGDKTSYFLVQGGTTKTALTVNPARLKNEVADPAFSATASTVAGKTWIYYDNQWQCWTQGDFCTYLDASDNPYAKPKDYVALNKAEVNNPQEPLFHDAETGTRGFIWDADCYWWEVDLEHKVNEGDFGVYQSIIPDHNGKYNYYEFDNDNACWKIKNVTVTWNGDGVTTTNYTNVGYGTKPKWLGATPTKSGYVWDGWTIGGSDPVYTNDDLPVVTSNTTFTSHFKSNPVKYNITFKNPDGKVLDSRNWESGSIPSYEGNPEREATVDKTYTWAGSWTPEITTVSAAKDYTAQYDETARQYDVTFLDYDNTELETKKVNYNVAPTYTGNPSTPTRVDPTDTYIYEFSGWKNQQTGTSGLAAVKGDQTYVAQYNHHQKWFNIRFVDYNGTTLQTGQVLRNTMPTPPANPTRESDAQYHYTFKAWSPDIAIATANATYTATYNTTLRSYTIRFLNNGEVLQTETLNYGVTPQYKGETPTNADESLEFVGWDDVMRSVSSNKDYIAQYTKKTYTVTVTSAGNGSVSGSGTYTHGATATLTAYPDEGYVFSQWNDGNPENPRSLTVTETATYTATFVSDETGTPLDIVGATTTSLTINANPLTLSKWPYTINGTSYGRTAGSGAEQCNADRTITITHDKVADAELPITVRDKNGELVSRHKYTIPHVYITDATLSGTDANSIVFINGGTLTVDGERTAKAIYVAVGAELKVEGSLNVEKLVLRTSPWEAAILTNNGTINATNTYYSRVVADNSKFYQFGLPGASTTTGVIMSDGSTPSATSWQMKIYSEADRAKNGISETGDNWLALDGTTIQGSKGYEIYSGSKYYREYYFPVNISEGETVSVQHTGDDAQNSGWNVVVSPKMGKYFSEPKPEDITICILQPEGGYLQEIPETIMPAVPFSYQAPEAGTLTFEASLTFTPAVSSAPRRRVQAAKEETRIQWIHLDILNADGEGDQTSIYSHPTRYEQTYKTGIDVAKQSLTASRAIIYSSHAYGDMAFAGVADTLLESGVALTVYSPATQDLTISLRDNEWLNRMESVWLIDKETGAKIDLLSSDYSYEAAEGTTRGRFFIQGQFKAPQVATELEPTSDSSLKGREIRKVIINQKMYIIVGEQIYDGTGKLVNK